MAGNTGAASGLAFMVSVSVAVSPSEMAARSNWAETVAAWAAWVEKNIQAMK